MKVYDDGRSLHDRLLAGVNKLADNVGSTLGPKGRNVILRNKEGSTVITKDGATVARFVDLEDPIANAGAQIVKQVSDETNNSAGDGTTTSTVLARAMLVEAQKYLAAGVSPVEMKRGMDSAVKQIIDLVQQRARPVQNSEDIERVATISANGDKGIGTLISKAVDQAGHDGSIQVVDAKSMETSLEVVEGFRFDSGYFAKAFVTDEKRHAVKLDSPIFFVTDYPVNAIQDFKPVLELAYRTGKPFILVTEECEGEPLATMIMNHMRQTIKCCAVKAPSYGEERRGIISDLALSVGATFFSRESGKKMEDVKLEDFGSAKSIEVLKNFTTIVDGDGDWEEIDKRMEGLKEEIRQTTDMHDCERLQRRVARLASGVAIIKIGGTTEIEATEKRHRIEDALEAVKSAQELGIVPGGGATLLRCEDVDVVVENEEQEIGVKIVTSALASPIRQMAENSGKSGDLIIAMVKDAWRRATIDVEVCGYDFASGEIEDFEKVGIFDPAKVTITALVNANSAVSTLLTSGHAIVEVER
jgi:chaperonin GroEL